MADEMTIASVGGMWRKLFAANVASATFATGGFKGRVNDPSTALGQSPFVAGANLAVINPDGEGAPGRPTFNAMMFKFFGTNANDNTASVRIWGVEKCQLAGSYSWEVVLLAELALILGNVQGLDGTAIKSADFEVDSFVLTSGATNDVPIALTADIRGAWCRIDTLGFEQLLVEFNLGTATDMNGIYRPIW